LQSRVFFGGGGGPYIGNQKNEYGQGEYFCFKLHFEQQQRHWANGFISDGSYVVMKHNVKKLLYLNGSKIIQLGHLCASMAIKIIKSDSAF